ncbi:MAG: ATP-grasp domain-containing protein [Pseudomonadota bacterium]
MKENILILNNARYEHYYKNKKPIIDYNRYNVFFITKKEYAAEIPDNDYSELHSINMSDSDAVFELARNIHLRYFINRVIALSESNILDAARIREFCGCKGMPFNQVLILRDKCLMKEYLSGKGINVPAFKKLYSTQNAIEFYQLYGRVVIKPALGMGSKNTYIIDTETKFNLALKCINNSILDYEIEEFVDGDMYHCDSIIVDGHVKLCSVSKYLDSTCGYLESQPLASVMEDDENICSRLQTFNSMILKAFGIKNDVTHLEVFYKDSNIVFCEIAIRTGGGGIIDSVEQKYSINLMETHLKLQLSQCEKLQLCSRDLYSGFVMFYAKPGIVVNITPADKFNQEWISKFKVYIKKGDRVILPKYNGKPAAIVIIVGKTKDDLINKVEWVKSNFRISYI